MSFSSNSSLSWCTISEGKLTKEASTFIVTNNFTILNGNKFTLINHVEFVAWITLIEDNLSGFIDFFFENITKLLLFKESNMIKYLNFLQYFPKLLSPLHKGPLHQIFEGRSVELVEGTWFCAFYWCCSWGWVQ